MASALCLTIQVHDTPLSSLPATLEQRLIGSPKTPEELQKTLEEHAKKTEALRLAHLEATKDRAARATQRAADVQARKLRAIAAAKTKIQARQDAQQTKNDAKKEATNAEREAKKQRREALASAVNEARKAADDARASRAAALRSAETLASAKHARAIADVKDKGALVAKKAIAIVSAHKERSALAQETIAATLAQKLCAAEARRDLASPRNLVSPRRSHDVLNEHKVSTEMQRRLLDATMAKASEKRAAHLASVKERAASVSEKAAAVVALHKAKAEGTDAATAEAKAALYEKMVNAETARLWALKAKYAKAAKQSDTIAAIVVRMDDVITPRPLPAALALRLATTSHALTATSAARQRAAASRRLGMKHAAMLLHAKANERRAAALTRVGKALAINAAKVGAKAARSKMTYAIGLGRRAHLIAREHERTEKVHANRQAMATALASAGEAFKAKCAAASEIRDAKLRNVAKTGVVAVRFARYKSRRHAADTAVAERGAALAARCEAAATKRAAVLAARVEVARKRQKAAHPRREMPDQEVKEIA